MQQVVLTIKKSKKKVEPATAAKKPVAKAKAKETDTEAAWAAIRQRHADPWASLRARSRKQAKEAEAAL